MTIDHQTKQEAAPMSMQALLVEVFEQAAVLVLQVLAKLHGLVQELSYLLKVGLLEAPGRHGWCPNAHTTWCHG